jgi:hypothetical protein
MPAITSGMPIQKQIPINVSMYFLSESESPIHAADIVRQDKPMTTREIAIIHSVFFMLFPLLLM